MNHTGDVRVLNYSIPLRLDQFRNPNFGGRADELERICRVCETNKSVGTPSIYALTGIGGIGKTQIALEYAYRYHEHYNAVFWVSAVSQESIKASFFRIMQRIVAEQVKASWSHSPPENKYETVASELDICGRIDRDGIINTDPEGFGIIKAALDNWFCSPENRNWLLVFDNADDLDELCLEEYFPRQGNGLILITSRRTLEFSSIGEEENLSGLDEQTAVNLLLKVAGLSLVADGKCPTRNAQLIHMIRYFVIGLC